MTTDSECKTCGGVGFVVDCSPDLCQPCPDCGSAFWPESNRVGEIRERFAEACRISGETGRLIIESNSTVWVIELLAEIDRLRGMVDERDQFEATIRKANEEHDVATEAKIETLQARVKELEGAFEALAAQSLTVAPLEPTEGMVSAAQAEMQHTDLPYLPDEDQIKAAYKAMLNAKD